jgi:hypothetical protein
MQSSTLAEFGIEHNIELPATPERVWRASRPGVGRLI